jgi:putative ABC transport system permease protein
MLSDVRYTTRMLLKSPGFSLVAILTLALGIGANTAIFSVINAVLLAPLPYPQADRIMTLEEETGGIKSSVAFPDYLDWRRDTTVFENLAVSRHDSRNLSGIPGREAERVGAAYVTANFFKVIGLAPEWGRTFTEEEDTVGGPALAVISDRLWARAFQRDPNVIGRSITLHNQIYTLIGVMPTAMTSSQETDVWFPIMRRSNNPGWQNRANHPMMFAWGRLKSGVTVQQARTEMKAIAARLEKQYPETNDKVNAVVTPLLENLVGEYRKNLALLLGAVGLVLLIACANLANLFAARGAARAREFAIRAAVGATRRQLIRQLLTESLVVAILGGAAGFMIALWGRDALVALGPQGVERFHNLHFDARVLGFTFLLACLTSIVFGLWPAWQTSRADVQLALKSGGYAASDSRSARRVRDFLIIGEIALTLVLLSSAGLVLKCFARVQSLSLGFEPRGLLTARVDLPFSAYSEAEKVGNFARTLLEKVRAFPGVQAAALSANPPLLGGWQIPFSREGEHLAPAQRPSAECEVVTADYFSTLRSTLLRGRVLTERDTKNSPLVVVIDQTLAEQIFPGQDPIGKRLLMEPFDEGEGDGLFQIVGVVARMKFQGFDDPSTLPVAYFSLGQVKRNGLVLFVRAGARAKSLEKAVQETVASIDPAQPVFDVRLLEDRVEETWATQRLLTFLLSTFAALALGLATIGLYGVIAYTSLRRLREIGLRLALGAQRFQILNLILSHGLKLLGIGVLLGLAGAAAASRLLRSVLFEVQAADLGIYLSVGTVLTFATLVACWLPAHRSARVDPMITLRCEIA